MQILHYFEGLPVHVITSHGLQEIVENYLTTVRIAKWDLDLMGLDITYIFQTTIKYQPLVDFMVE
jgi:hypothetical protein